MEENKKIENPAAFPFLWDARHNPEFAHTEGMTLRDYFAAKAMQGIISNDAKRINTGDSVNEIKIGHIAQEAYVIANAMLKYRSNNPEIK